MRDAFPAPRGPADLRVIGIGNPWRQDDGAGPAVCRRLRGALPPSVAVLEREGDPAGLIDDWDGATAVWLADVARMGAAPGAVLRLDAARAPLPAGPLGPSGHLVGLAETVELARALGRLPPRLVVFAIEGAGFGAGARLSDPVADAVERVADAIAGEVAATLRAAAPER